MRMRRRGTPRLGREENQIEEQGDWIEDRCKFMFGVKEEVSDSGADRNSGAEETQIDEVSTLAFAATSVEAELLASLG